MTNATSIIAEQSTRGRSRLTRSTRTGVIVGVIGAVTLAGYAMIASPRTSTTGSSRRCTTSPSIFVAPTNLMTSMQKDQARGEPLPPDPSRFVPGSAAGFHEDGAPVEGSTSYHMILVGDRENRDAAWY